MAVGCTHMKWVLTPLHPSSHERMALSYTEQPPPVILKNLPPPPSPSLPPITPARALTGTHTHSCTQMSARVHAHTTHAHRRTRARTHRYTGGLQALSCPSVAPPTPRDSPRALPRPGTSSTSLSLGQLLLTF